MRDPERIIRLKTVLGSKSAPTGPAGMNRTSTAGSQIPSLGVRKAGSVRSDSVSDRPIFTLLYAGVGGCIDNSFGRYHWQHKAWCRLVTRYALMTPKQRTLRRCKLPGKQHHLTKRVHTCHPVQMPLRRPGPDPLWQISSKHLYEPWLTTTATSGAGSPRSRTGAAMENSARRKLMS
jgi:hypothetical protein